MNKYQKSIKMKIIFSSLSVLLMVMLTIHLAIYFYVKDTIEHHLKLNVQAVATAISKSIMLDIDRYMEFVETKDVNTGYYEEMQKYFRLIKEDGDLSYIYTTRRITDSGNDYEFILDAEEIGSNDYSAPGDIDSFEELKEVVYNTQEAFSFGSIDYSEWGQLITGYAPIFDKSGNIVSLVGVDMDGGVLYRYLTTLHLYSIMIYIIISIVLTFFLSKSSNFITESLLKDPLTGAYSKRCFGEIINDEIVNSIKNKKELAIMMLDLDYFKNVNDTYGHSFGDIVLSTISKSIKNNLRPSDYFIRYGGEEFLIIINTNGGQAFEIAERIRKKVSNLKIYNDEFDNDVKITISIGIKVLGNQILKPNELIEQADKALYEAKKERNKVVLLK